MKQKAARGHPAHSETRQNRSTPIHRPWLHSQHSLHPRANNFDRAGVSRAREIVPNRSNFVWGSPSESRCQRWALGVPIAPEHHNILTALLNVDVAAL